MNTDDIRQEDSHNDHHRASLYEDIHHSRCLSSQHSTKPDKYDGSARVSLHQGTSQAVLPEPHSTNSSMPDLAASADQVRLYKDYLKVDKYEYSHMKSPIRSYMKKDAYNVPSSISNTKGLLRHKPVIQFDNSHKTSTYQDQLKVVE